MSAEADILRRAATKARELAEEMWLGRAERVLAAMAGAA